MIKYFHELGGGRGEGGGGRRRASCSSSPDPLVCMCGKVDAKLSFPSPTPFPFPSLLKVDIMAINCSMGISIYFLDQVCQVFLDGQGISPYLSLPEQDR